MSVPPSARGAAVCLVGLLMTFGCSRSDVDNLVNKVKDTAAEGTKKVKDAVADNIDRASTQVQEQLAMAGNAQLTLDAPVTTKACYARFIQQGSGRPNVLELRSYHSVDQEEFPSVFLHANVTANSLEDLFGQIVSARLFVQPDASGPVWYSSAAAPVEVKIVGKEDDALVAELVGGSLLNTDSDAETAVTGTFNAVVR